MDRTGSLQRFGGKRYRRSSNAKHLGQHLVGERQCVSVKSVARMKQHPWQGNVRELKNYIHRVFIMAGDEGLEGPAPDSEQTPMRNTTSPSLSSSPPSNVGPAITVALGTPLSVAARELILSTLQHCGGERKRTAEMLGICTKTLYNRLREYGIREEQGRSAMGEQRVT